MIEFKGALSPSVREKQISKETNARRISFSIFTGISLICLILSIITKAIFNNGFELKDLMTGTVTPFLFILTIVLLILTILWFVKPQIRDDLQEGKVFSVCFDNDKITFTPESGFGKREFNYSNLKKIYDEGEYYLVVSKEHNIRIVCQKDLIVQGDLNEFDNYFNNVIVRTGDATGASGYKPKKEEKTENLEKDKTEEVVVEVKDEDVTGASAKKEKVEDSTALEGEVSGGESKTFSNEKFKKTKTRNEKSFKFALLGIIFGVLSVALTPIIVRFGINFAVSSIEYVFNNLFYGGFVIEAITFLLALLITFISAVVLFGGCVLLTPVVALLSLIFPIYQLAAVNHRWFSWVALAIGIMCIIGCGAMTILTLQGL